MPCRIADITIDDTVQTCIVDSSWINTNRNLLYYPNRSAGTLKNLIGNGVKPNKQWYTYTNFTIRRREFGTYNEAHSLLQRATERASDQLDSSGVEIERSSRRRGPPQRYSPSTFDDTLTGKKRKTSRTLLQDSREEDLSEDDCHETEPKLSLPPNPPPQLRSSPITSSGFGGSGIMINGLNDDSLSHSMTSTNFDNPGSQLFSVDAHQTYEKSYRPNGRTSFFLEEDSFDLRLSSDVENHEPDQSAESSQNHAEGNDHTNRSNSNADEGIPHMNNFSCINSLECSRSSHSSKTIRSFSPTTGMLRSTSRNRIRSSSPTTGIINSSPTTGRRGSSPTTVIRGSTSTTGIRGFSPTNEIRCSTPTTGRRGSSPTTGIRGSTSTTGIRSFSPTTGMLRSISRNRIRSSSPTTGIINSTPATGRRSSSPTTAIRCSTSTTGARSFSPTTGILSSTSINRIRSSSATTGIVNCTPTTGRLSSSPTTGINSSSPTSGIRGSTLVNGIRSSTQTNEKRSSYPFDESQNSPQTNGVRSSSQTIVIRNGQSADIGHSSISAERRRHSSTGLQIFMNDQRELINLMREERNDRQHVNSRRNNDNLLQENRIILPKDLGLPLKNLEEFRIFNAMLSEPDQRAKLVAFIRQLGVPSGIDAVSMVWKKLIKDSLARLFNWNGRIVKDKPNKVAFGKKRMWRVVFDALHGLHPATPLLEEPFVRATKNWLRHSPARFANKQHREQLLEYPDESDEEF